MPKVRKLGLHSEQNDLIRRCITSGMDFRGVDREKLIKQADISESTFYNRLKNPEEIKLSELRIFIRECGIRPEYILKTLYSESDLQKYSQGKG